MAIDGALLHRIINEYEALEQDRKDVMAQQRELIEVGVDAGFDKAALKQFIRELRKDPGAVRDQIDLVEQLRVAWLEFDSTPLGMYASSRPTLVDDVNH